MRKRMTYLLGGLLACLSVSVMANVGSTQVADKQLELRTPTLVERADVIGIWRESEWHPEAQATSVGYTYMVENGTWRSKSTVVFADGQIQTVTIQGTWKLDGNTLTYTLTESSEDTLAGITFAVDILRVDEDTVQYIDPDGIRQTDYKVHAQN